MGTCSFQIRNETFFCKVKLKIPDFEREKSRDCAETYDFEREKSRDCAETYIWYVAQARPPRLSEQARDGGQGTPLIDPRGIGCAFHRAGAEIAKKGHFWMETSQGTFLLLGIAEATNGKSV
jgi:hypothetical protein